MLERNIVAAGGSDSPIEHPNPLLGLYYAITRVGATGEVFRPEEKLSFREAMNLYTVNAAFVAKEESKLGELQENWEADFIVVDSNIEEDPERLLHAKVTEVYRIMINAMEFRKNAVCVLPKFHCIDHCPRVYCPDMLGERE